jgi:hypothetical protein
MPLRSLRGVAAAHYTAGLPLLEPVQVLCISREGTIELVVSGGGHRHLAPRNWRFPLATAFPLVLHGTCKANVRGILGLGLQVAAAWADLVGEGDGPLV